MSLIKFPPLSQADENGLLAIGGDLCTETLIHAYSSGIFPWPLNDDFLAWFAPPKRAVLFLDKFHPSSSLLRLIKKKVFEIRTNTNFEKVIQHCSLSMNRKGQKGTWITDEMIEAYCVLHKEGYAHSIECYFGDKLSGGIYGVSIGKMFAGESMFYIEPNASKIALYYLVQILKEQGVTLLDCQVMTPHSKKFGAVDISREEFNKYLRKSIKEKKIELNNFQLNDSKYLKEIF